MDITTIATLISSVGFPIAACCVLFWQMKTQDERHQEEVKTLTTSINNNTLAIQQLVDKLGG